MTASANLGILNTSDQFLRIMGAGAAAAAMSNFTSVSQAMESLQQKKKQNNGLIEELSSTLDSQEAVIMTASANLGILNTSDQSLKQCSSDKLYLFFKCSFRSLFTSATPNRWVVKETKIFEEVLSDHKAIMAVLDLL